MTASRSWPLGSEVGEGPLWDAGSGSVLSSDLLRGLVLRTNISTGVTETRDVGGAIGAIGVVRHRGSLVPDVYVVAHANHVSLLHFASGRVEPLLEVPQVAGDLRWNDGKVDPLGRLVVGTMTDALVPGVAGLFAIASGSSGCRVVQLLDGVTASNGLDWSPAGDRFYYVDSATYQLVAYPYPIDGAEPTVLASFSRETGIPDGLCTDSAGDIWLAVWGSNRIFRLSPDGQIQDEVRLPVSNVSSCAFGGPDLTSLYVTSAHYTLSPEQKAAQPLAGSLFEVPTGIRGRPPTPFELTDAATLSR